MPQIDIFIINLKRSKERRARMENLLGSLGLRYEFIEAVDGNDLSEKEILEIQRNAADPPNRLPGRKQFSRGEIGCALSHLKVLERIVKEGLDYACIMEDDMVIEHPGILRTMLEKETLVALNKKRRFGIISLYTGWPNKDIADKVFPKAASLSFLNSRWGKVKIKEGLYLRRPCVAPLWGSVCIIITKETCDKLLTEARAVRRPVDHLTACCELFGPKLYFTDPAPVGHDYDQISAIDPHRNIRIGNPASFSPSRLRIVWCNFTWILRKSGIIPYRWLLKREWYD